MVSGAAVMLMAVAPAAVARSSLPSSLSVSSTGSVTVTWQGDPARGCAADGLCGTYGDEVLTSDQGSEYASSGPVTSFSVSLSGTIRVRRTENGAAAGDCVEQSNDAFGPTLNLLRGPRGKWTAAIQPAPSSGTCAGPLASDVAQLALPISQYGSRYPTFELTGTRAFVAGPFTGEVISAMEVTTSPASLSNSGGPNVPPPKRVKPHRVFSEYTRLSYRVSAEPSALQFGFTGTSDPICQAFDACGTTGSIVLSLARPHSSLVLSASRVVRKPGSYGTALRDFRRGLLPLDFDAPDSISTSDVLTEQLTRADGSSCEDSVTDTGLQVQAGASSASTNPLPFSLIDQDDFEADPLRTHCAGPAQTDIFELDSGFGFASPIANGTLSPAQLLSPSTELALSAPGSFNTLGYSGTRGGALVLQLTLVGLKAGFREEERS